MTGCRLHADQRLHRGWHAAADDDVAPTCTPASVAADAAAPARHPAAINATAVCTLASVAAAAAWHAADDDSGDACVAAS